MQFIYSGQFIANSKKLPVSIQNKLAKLLDIFSADPFHPLLHTKRLSGKLISQYSFRITRDWRALFVYESRDIIKLIDVGHRKDIYR